MHFLLLPLVRSQIGVLCQGIGILGKDSSVNNVSIQRRLVNTIILAAVEQGASGIGQLKIILQLNGVKSGSDPRYGGGRDGKKRKLR